MFFLVSISVDRFVAITIALRYEQLVTRKRAIILVCVSWIAISGIIILLTLLKKDQMTYNHATFFCEPAFEDPEFPLSLLILIVGWIMTGSLIMMGIYGHLFRVAHRHSRRIAAQGQAAAAAAEFANRPKPRWSFAARVDMKAVRMCLAVTLAFNVAWIPTLCLDCYKFIKKENAVSGVEFAITWLSLSNSWWNFLIYSVMNKQFRDAAKELGEQLLAKCKRVKTTRHPVEQGPPSVDSRQEDQSRHPGDDISY